MAAKKTETKAKKTTKKTTKKDTIKPIEKAKKPEKKKLLFVASEVQPFAVSGGLGEVAGSLPVSLAQKHKLDVRVVLPLYRCIGQPWRKKMKQEKVFQVQLGWRSQYCGIFSLKQHGVTYYFVDNEYYFHRDNLYGYYDDGERFGYFCRAVMDMFHELDYYPDVVHANDWQCALIPIYNMSVYHYGFKSVFTIHNIAYQGQYDLAILGDVFGLDAEAGAYVEYQGCINLMKGAIQCSNLVTTVSPSYAQELKDPFYAECLEKIIQENDYKLRGILNGISTKIYNAQTDPEIAANFTKKDLSGKAIDKRELQKQFQLKEDPDVPIIAIVSRLVYHKGMHLIQGALGRILQENVQLVVLGVGDDYYQDYFRWLHSQYASKVGVNLSFNGSLSHRIYAGADMFLMPSLSEPCGLAQMIASQYGTVPIVRETGGLRDSIHDCSLGEGNGFTFASMEARDLEDAVLRALELYKDKDAWEKLCKHIMGIDFSWRNSASQYMDLYRELIEIA